MTQRVFVDANVLVSKTLMDWLFLLRLENPAMFQVHSTEDVFAEVIANMRKKCPTAPGHRTAQRAQLIRKNMDEVLQGFPSDLDFTGTDRHDYHVHAGAVFGGADIILTPDTYVRPGEPVTYEGTQALRRFFGIEGD
ncbi:hypothetical protein ACIP1V_06580 [Kocuria marina]|uniref:hypothetical protein n=1 Tax=Kocuria marina TaxID=223184 RepID=UPI00382AD045